MRHALGHGPTRRVGAPGPLLSRNRSHQLVEPRLRAPVFVSDDLELWMHASYVLGVVASCNA